MGVRFCYEEEITYGKFGVNLIDCLVNLEAGGELVPNQVNKLIIA